LLIEQIAFAAFDVNPDVSEELIAQARATLTPDPRWTAYLADGIRETAKRGHHSPALWLKTIPLWITAYHKRAPIPIRTSAQAPLFSLRATAVL
jgi:hypothetical protein